MDTMEELQHELESLAPPPPSAMKLRAIARQRRRRHLTARTAVGVAAVALMGLAISQLQNGPQTVGPADESFESDKGVLVSQDKPEPSTTASEAASCSEGADFGISASEYLGLREAEAVLAAKDAGLTPIVQCRDGNRLVKLRPLNIDQSRLWLTITDGVVTNSYLQ